MFDELGSHAWVVESLRDGKTRVITEDSLAAMLNGVPTREAVGVTFFLQVGVVQNIGPAALNKRRRFTTVVIETPTGRRKAALLVMTAFNTLQTRQRGNHPKTGRSAYSAESQPFS